MALYLVTGGAGFIGSNIVDELLRRGQKVRVLDNFSTGKRENIAQFAGKIELVEGDVRSYHVVRSAVEGANYILHQAALPSVPRSIADPITTNDVNIDGTLNVLNAAREEGVRRMVYASSSSIYGNSPELPKVESMCPAPVSPYAVSKLAGEKYCEVFSGIYGLDTVVLRYFNVFGPRQDPGSQYSAVIPKFIRAAAGGARPVIYGDGRQSRDFTYVGNVVDANIRAATARISGPGRIFNIAGGRRVSLLALVAEINAVLGTRVKPVMAGPRKGEVKHSQAGIGLAARRLGYRPAVDFSEGVRRTIRWMEGGGF